MADVIAVFGPTASGKSAAALELARELDGEIVSCDAMQLYRGLPILTNQPTAEELAAAPHHLVGVWPLDHEGSVAEYADIADAAVDEVISRGRTPILCGGSGLYLRAAIAPLDLPPPPAEGAREKFAQLYDERGAEAAHQLLAHRDPRAAAAVHPNDRRRVVRALELTESGASLTPDVDTSVGPPRPPQHDRVRDPGRVGCRARPHRAAHAGDVRARRGGRGEVGHRGPALVHRPPHPRSAGRDGAAGRRDRPEEAIRRLDARTRRYAKRQRVWMRRLPGLVPVSSAAEMIRLVKP